jgi:hypothetical protein
LRFELAQLHADGGWRSVKAGGGMRETAQLDARDHRAKRVHIEVNGIAHFRFIEVTISNYAIFGTMEKP